MGRPFAYLRKSRVNNLDASLAPETQERTVREMARQFGDNGDRLHVLADWDISGAAKYTRKRAGYLELVKAIEVGDCTAVYSYSLSRLGRSVQELSRLFDLCHDHGVPIRTSADSIDTSTASGRMTATILASVAQFESEVTSERRRATNDTARAQARAAGIPEREALRTRRRYGESNGEDPDRVLALYRETGSYSRTAEALNLEGIPARSGKQWYATSVRIVVQRMDPTIRSAPRGRKPRVPFVLARLLRCPTCETLLTGTRVRRGAIRYACSNYAAMPHPRSSVSEALVKPWIIEKVDGLRPPSGPVQLGAAEDGVGSRRAELEAERAHVTSLALDPRMDRRVIDVRLAEIDKEIEVIENKTNEAAVVLPPINWNWSDQDINGLLRLAIDHVVLGPDLRPMDIKWRGRIAEWAA